MEWRVGEGHAVHEVVERHGDVRLGKDHHNLEDTIDATVFSVFADVSCRRVMPLFVDGATSQIAESMSAPRWERLLHVKWKHDSKQILYTRSMVYKKHREI